MLVNIPKPIKSWGFFEKKSRKRPKNGILVQNTPLINPVSLNLSSKIISLCQLKNRRVAKVVQEQ